ncbi:glycosyltransferase [Halonotius terrestris]|uniref:Glycosyltransferase n=1 Tax=Halonotius terrestris TaxID=2487750 RepID=A0A8J8TCL8_9EURY|nr:glycosyltransferase [Halonotius terrestris]TQQ81114.1 glycosyltransferase [Halonotius terrestris]
MSTVVVHDGAIHPGGAVKVVLEACHALEADLVVGVSGMDQDWWESRAPNGVRLLSRKSKMGTIQDIRNAYRMLNLSLKEYEYIITSGPATKFFQPYDQQTHIHYLHHPPLSKLWFDGGLFEYAKSIIDRIETLSIPVVVANSQLTADRYWKHYARSADYVINPPVETESFSWNSEHIPGKFVMVGRLEERKRPLLAVKAFAELADRDDLAKIPELHLVGDGPLADEAQVKATSNIYVHGYVRDEKLRQIVESSDAGVFLAESEDFGITPIEYMSAGLPVLGVDEPNTNNQIKQGVSGLLVAPEKEAVGDGVLEIMEREWNRKEISKGADEYSSARFRKEIREVVEHV